MGAKVYDSKIETNGNRIYFIHCPGCECAHPLYVPMWKWNLSFEKPTFSPSLMCDRGDVDKQCHSFIKDGMIQFLNDCAHKLKGTTVEIPDWDDNDRPTSS